MKYLIALSMLAAPLAAAPAEQPARKQAGSMLGKGYLAPGPMPDSLLLSPAPPAAGSPAQARDDAASKAGLALKGGPRWILATQDADLFGPKATSALSCAAGVEISAQTTPKTDKLLRRTMADLGLSTSAIKKAHQRPRPFMVHGQQSCTPNWEPMLRKDGSYPSGHSAIGFGWGLIVAELVPDRAAQIVARGRAFGDSRYICNVHWLSDVEEGRVVAAATVARLNADRAFQKDMKTARAELKKAKVPPQNCDAEAQALAATPREL